jgi:hypothetical protein
VALVDRSDCDCYVVDIFRVVGGTDHAKFVHSHFGTVKTAGLTLVPAPDYGHGALMRNFTVDAAPAPGWSLDWTVEDRYGYVPDRPGIHVRYTDLTEGVAAYLAEGWIIAGIFNSTAEAWIPRAIVRRKSTEDPLASTFVSVIEPYEGTPAIARIERLRLENEAGERYADPHVALEVRGTDGRSDVIVAVDRDDPLGRRPAWNAETAVLQKRWNLSLRGELCMVRYGASGAVDYLALCRGRELRAGDVQVRLTRTCDFVELRLLAEEAVLLGGGPACVEAVERKGSPLKLRADRP